MNDDSSRRVPLPRGWLSFALLQWGAFTDNLAGAFVMALMLEAVGLVKVKWAMGAREFHRAADLTSVIFAVITVIQFSRFGVHGIYGILGVTPYCFFPLILAQRAGTAGTIPLSALVYSLRRWPDHNRPLDIGPHYVFICILAACGARDDGWTWIVTASLLLGGVLLAMRPQRYTAVHWCGSLFVAVWLAVAAGAGVIATYRAAEGTFAYWMSQFPWSAGDPNRAITAIGAIGRLKLSDQIRVRVRPGRDVQLPLLLQEASFDEFRYGSWKATEAPFEAVDKLAGRDAWDTGVEGAAGRRLELTFQHNYDLTLLPLPRGTVRITSGEISEIQRNRFGTLMAEAPPGALRYVGHVADGGSPEPPPTAADLAVPDAYRPVITDVLAEAGVVGTDDAANVERVRRFFLDNFTYSLIQRGRYGQRLPLADFLRHTRRGHCEFFASASVLALRAAGIPSRYAVGYVVENYSELENAYIARARHAHAWALAWVDGAWITVDATPSVWYDLEEARASSWQTFSDLLSWLHYRYQRLLQADFSDLGDWLIWLVPVLAVVLYLRLRRSPMAVHADNDSNDGPAPAARAALTALLDHFADRGLRPARGETMARFLRRALPDGGTTDALVEVYQRQRFAPDTGPADTAQLARLQQLAAAALAALTSRAPTGNSGD